MGELRFIGCGTSRRLTVLQTVRIVKRSGGHPLGAVTMRHSIVRVGLLMATVACFAAGAHSATLNVGPGGYASIQAAIDAASEIGRAACRERV